MYKKKAVLIAMDPGLCPHVKKDGAQCRNKPGQGTDHHGVGKCSAHGGNSPSHRKSAARVILNSFTEGVEVDPVEALQQALWLSAGAVTFCQAKITSIEQMTDKGHDVTWDMVEKGEITRDEYHLGRTLATWMELYNEERDRLAKTAATAIGAGLQERQVKVLEDRAGKLADALRRTFDDIGLNEEQRMRAIPALRRYLEAGAA